MYRLLQVTNILVARSSGTCSHAKGFANPSNPKLHNLLYSVLRIQRHVLISHGLKDGEGGVRLMAKKKTDKQRKAHMDYFTRLGIDTSCVVCGSEDWIIGRTGPAFDVGDGRKVMPVEIICNFCGRIATYDGRVIGNV